LSYCSFEAFKVLAKNYLRLETHHLYSKIQELLGETKMTPAEVAEHLMPKTLPGDNKVCLEGLIAGLEKAKEDARLKAEEEAREKGSSPEEKATEKDSSPEEKAKEKDSSPEENAKEQGKENGFCDNGNTETNCKEKE
jgi:chaperone BCS1